MIYKAPKSIKNQGA